MTKFIRNLNLYLSEMKIKQTYLSKLTGIQPKKMSRLLTGVQEESGSDMEIIAKALGKDVAFFLREPFEVPSVGTMEGDKIAFYAGEPTEKQEEIASLLMELMENVDVVLSARRRFENIAGGYDGY